MKPTSQELGVINAASPTPLDAAGDCDLEATRSLCRRWRHLPLDGVLLLGSMGEGPLLSDRARESFVDGARGETAGSPTLFVSVADLSRQRMIERARRSAALGAGWIVITATPGQSVSRALADVRSVAEAAPVPCIYYDVPVNTGVTFALDDLLELASHPNIHAIKDSSGNALLAQALASPAHRPPGLAVFDGTEYRTAHSAALGYDGVIHGGGVLTARAVRRIWELARQGDWQEAFRLDRENSLFLAAVYNRFSRPLQNIAGQKYALQLLNVFRSADCSVDQTVGEEARARIERAVAGYRQWLG